MVNANVVGERLSTQIASMQRFSEQIISIEEIKAGLEAESKNCDQDRTIYQTWLDSEIDRATTFAPLSSGVDGEILARIARKLPSQIIFDKYATVSVS